MALVGLSSFALKERDELNRQRVATDAEQDS